MSDLKFNKEPFLISLGERLREIRESKGWSMREVEQRGFSSYAVLSLIEKGKRDIQVSSLAKLCEIYGVSIQEVMGSVDPT